MIAEADFETDAVTQAAAEALLQRATVQRQSGVTLTCGELQPGLGNGSDLPNLIHAKAEADVDVPLQRVAAWVDEGCRGLDDDPVPDAVRRAEEIAAELIRVTVLAGAQSRITVRPLPPVVRHIRRRTA